MEYEQLSCELSGEISKRIGDSNKINRAIRRDMKHDIPSLWRPCFIRDVEKIIHNPYYNRYADKTQVFSFYKNDDISRRALHVQLVSRIARNIGRMLFLDLDLIEAIALGHDLGHTPFGHAGEKFLSEIVQEKTGEYFNHNVQSARVLDGIFHVNMSLQVLDGILCHNGEFECSEYRPKNLESFDEFDKTVEQCTKDESVIKTLIPSTLEGCVVRISDMIAYVGKDRQDAIKTHIIDNENIFSDSGIGKFNAVIINNLIVNIIENSYNKDYIMLDRKHFDGLKITKSENYKKIYLNDAIKKRYDDEIKPMFIKLYDKLLFDLKASKKSSVIYKHHINFVNSYNKYYKPAQYEEANSKERIVTDFIASMTDDYFIDLYSYLFPDSHHIEYKSYFYDIERFV